MYSVVTTNTISIIVGVLGGFALMFGFLLILKVYTISALLLTSSILAGMLLLSISVFTTSTTLQWESILGWAYLICPIIPLLLIVFKKANLNRKKISFDIIQQ